MPEGLMPVIGWLSLGWILLAIEVLVPGGILGTIGGLILIWACWLAFDLGPLWGMGAVATSVAAAIAVLYLFNRSRTMKGLILSDARPATWRSASPELAQLLGRRGRALTDLRPAGTAEIEGARVDVVADGGDLIERGTDIEVVFVEGVRVVVAPAIPAPEPTMTPASSAAPGAPTTEPEV